MKIIFDCFNKKALVVFLALVAASAANAGFATNDVRLEIDKLISEADLQTLVYFPTRQETEKSLLAQLVKKSDGPVSSENMLRFQRAVHKDLVDQDFARKTKAPTPQYDVSNFTKNSNGAPKGEAEQCEKEYVPDATTAKGEKIKMLNYALIYVGRGKGGSRFGHNLQRFDYCRNEKLVNMLITDGPLQPSDLAKEARNQYGIEMATESKIEPEKKAALLLFTWVIDDINNFYNQRQIADDRSVFEAHISLSGTQMYRALLLNSKRLSLQKSRILKNETIPHYSVLSNSCVEAFKDTIDQIIPGYTHSISLMIIPGQIFNFVSQRLTKKIIAYPKAELARSVGLLQ